MRRRQPAIAGLRAAAAWVGAGSWPQGVSSARLYLWSGACLRLIPSTFHQEVVSRFHHCWSDGAAGARLRGRDNAVAGSSISGRAELPRLCDGVIDSGGQGPMASSSWTVVRGVTLGWLPNRTAGW